MQKIDRTKTPDSKAINKIDLIKASQKNLDNGIPLYYINAGEQELIQIDIIFPAGNWYQKKHLVALITNSMLNEGTLEYPSAKISEIFDFYGAFLQLSTEKDSASISLFALNKYLENLLPIFHEIITNSIFPAKEFKTILQNNKQQFIVNNKKVSHVARNNFNKIIFGDNHPYGISTKAEDFDNLKIQDLKEFYKSQYNLNNAKIILSGKVNDKIISLINKYFGTPIEKHSNIKESNIAIKTTKSKKHFIKKDDALQSAIRIGKILFNKTHKDFHGMLVLNTVLGGYFGSRLMTNIREDKGYTYGIGSAIASLKHSGYIFITTEVGEKYTKNTINEIFFEIDRLSTELIPKDELELVRSYMLGSIMQNADGPFALGELFKDLLAYNMGYEYFDNLIKTIKTITPEELQVLAKKYLQKESMFELVVGKN